MSLNSLYLKIDARMEQVFNAYPEYVKSKILHLRSLILDVANGIDSINTLEETLKWGEPSYLVKKEALLE